MAWLSAARGVRRWRVQLLHSFQRHTEAEENLRKAHEQLEARVKERTGELAKTNRALQAETPSESDPNRPLQESEAPAQKGYRPVVTSIALWPLHHSAGKILEFNPAAEKVFGHPRAEVLG